MAGNVDTTTSRFTNERSPRADVTFQVMDTLVRVPPVVGTGVDPVTSRFSDRISTISR